MEYHRNWPDVGDQPCGLTAHPTPSECRLAVAVCWCTLRQCCCLLFDTSRSCILHRREEMRWCHCWRVKGSWYSQRLQQRRVPTEVRGEPREAGALHAEGADLRRPVQRRNLAESARLRQDAASSTSY